MPTETVPTWGELIEREPALKPEFGSAAKRRLVYLKPDPAFGNDTGRAMFAWAGERGDLIAPERDDVAHALCRDRAVACLRSEGWRVLFLANPPQAVALIDTLGRPYEYMGNTCDEALRAAVAAVLDARTEVPA